MDLNNILLLATSVCSVGFVLVAWKLDKDRLFGVILLFLILISITGGKLVMFFGHQTNAGNIFYASAFLATYFLIERYGKREGYRSIGMVVIGLIFFLVLLQLAVALVGSPTTQTLNLALSTAFTPTFRIASASLLAFVFAQSLNVSLYVFLKRKFGYHRVWIRANVSNILAQILDSLIFFTVAFWGIAAPASVLDILLTGFVIKVLLIMITSPLLYLNRVEHEEEKHYSMLTLR